MAKDVNRIICGAALETLQAMPEGSVNCSISSPPYWSLRDYGVEGQLGLEKTFEEYIDKLCTIYDEVKRVLRKDGCCFVNLGDTYAGSGRGLYGDGKSHGTEGAKQQTNVGSVGVPRVESYGTSGTKLGDCPDYDYLFENLCGVCLKAYLIGKFHNDSLPFPMQSALPSLPSLENKEFESCRCSSSDSFDQGNHISSSSLGLGQISNPLILQLLSFLESKDSSFSDESSVYVSNQNHAAKCLCCGRSFASGVSPSEHKADNKKHILSIVSSLVSHKNSNHNAYPYHNYTNEYHNVKDKSLFMIPQRFALEMIRRGWILRNVIIWAKPNPMPSSAKDRFTVDFEYVYFFVKSKKYFFEPIYEPLVTEPHSPGKKKLDDGVPRHNPSHPSQDQDRNWGNTLGRNKRTVWKPTKEEWLEWCEKVWELEINSGLWTIPTQAYPDAHFATFPEKLVEPMILSGCPREVCSKCGQGRRKVYETVQTTDGRPKIGPRSGTPCADARGGNKCPDGYILQNYFKGYTDCGCKDREWRPGVVLDCFRRIRHGRQGSRAA